MADRERCGAVRWRLLLGIPLGLLVLALGCRAFLGEVLVLSSGSMEPALLGGPGRHDRVLVLFGQPRSWRRGELAVFRQPGADAAAVKRVAGLPGESVQIAEGDLYVDGERRSALESGTLWIPWFDAGLQPLDRWFEGAAEVFDSADGALVLESRGPEPARAWTRHEIDLGYLLPNGERVAGTGSARDFRAELQVAFGDLAGGGWFEVQLAVEGEAQRLRLWPLEGGRVNYALFGGPGDEPGKDGATLAEGELACDLSAAVSLTLSRCDGRVGAQLAGNVLFEVELERSPAPALPPRTLPSVAIAARGLRAEITRLAIARDVHYLGAAAFGPYGVERPLHLGPGELYLLGDHSGDSLDGRRFGAIGADEIVGRAAAIVWPPSRWRRLGPASGE